MGLMYLLFIFVILVIVFQPEIRRWLKQVGRLKLFFIGLIPRDINPEELAKDITQIVQSVKELSKNKHGALIVIEPPETEYDYLSPGTEINGDISSNLILTIFTPKALLHDGAIIIQKDKIKAAGVILPITDNRKLSHIYGTRHRAALGLTEIIDCLCIVVSEETGSVSIAYHGNLISCKRAEEVTDYLTQFYSQLQITNAIVDSESAKEAGNSKISHIQLKRIDDSDENMAKTADA